MGLTLTGAVVGLGLTALSARWNWWRPRTRGLPILMYHRIGRAPGGSRLKKLWVTPERFRRHLAYAIENGYTPTFLSELLHAGKNGCALPDRPIIVTFDDGYADNYEAAFPILKEMKAKANVFLVCDAVDSGCDVWQAGSREPKARMLTWERILEMQGSGLVEFGSHSMRHRNLTQISSQEALWEIGESRKRLEEKLGRSVVSFAYPYGAGAYAPEVRSLVRRFYPLDLGVKQGLAAIPGAADQGPLKRLLVRGDDTMLDFHLNLTRGRARL